MAEEVDSAISEFIEIAPGRIIHRHQLAHDIPSSYRANTDFVIHPDKHDIDNGPRMDNEFVFRVDEIDRPTK